MIEFVRICGIALIIGGILLILINVFLSPSYLDLFKQEGDAVARSSRIYLIRISAALVESFLLILGCIGLYLNQYSASGKFGAVAFFAAFIGACLLFAIEWSNLFVLRAVAQTSPDTLGVLDKSKLMTVGFASGAGVFMIGWLLLSISLWQAGVVPLWTALTTLAGLLLIPILGVTPLAFTGQIIGNVVFGIGLIGLGYSLF